MLPGNSQGPFVTIMASVDSVPTPAAQAEPPFAAEGLLARVLQNSFWLFNSSVLVRLLNLARSILLARLLMPEDFGLFGLASSIIGFTLVFGDVGIGLSLLYRRDPEDEYKSTAFWMNLTLSSLLLGAVTIASPLLSSIYARRELIPILVVLATAFWCQVAAVVHRNLLRRELRFRALAAVDAVASAVSFGVAVALASWGGGVWAFVLSLLTGNVVSLVLLWWSSGWSPTWRWSRSASKEIGIFSGWYLGAVLASYLAVGFDKLLIGKWLGMADLGHYVIAYDFSIVLSTVFTAPLLQAIVPELTQLREEPAKFWTLYSDYCRLAALVLAPVFGIVWVSAGDIFPLVFGAKWMASVLPFQFLATFMLLRSILGDSFAATGRYDLSVRLSLGLFVFGVFGIWFSVRYGVNAVAAVVSLVCVFAYIVALRMTSGSLRIYGVILRNSFPFAIAAVFSTLVGSGAREMCKGFPEPKYWMAVVPALFMLASYAALTRRSLRGVIALWRAPTRAGAG